MAQIQLFNRSKQSVRTQLYKVGKIGKDEVEIPLAPRTNSIVFDESLLTPVAKEQIKKKFLQIIKVEEN